MADRIAGSIKNVTFAGINLTPVGEASIDIPTSIFKKETVPTSGKPITKFILEPQVIDKHDYGITEGEVQDIIALSNTTIAQEVAFTLRSGVSVTGRCFIDSEKFKSMDAVVAIGFNPTELENWEWSV